MKVKNNSARPYFVRGLMIAPGAVVDLPNDAKADIEGMDELEPATAKDAKEAEQLVPMGAMKNPMASTQPDADLGGTQIPENAKQAEKLSKGK